MMSITLETLGTVLALALVVAGLVALLFPKPMSHAYGAPVEGEAGYGFVRASGVRDLLIGAVLAFAVATRDVPMIAVFAGAGLALAVADFVIAYHAGGRRLHLAHAVHAAGAVAFVLMLAMALFAIGK
ncbi:MAG TPA: DUF4267 domain-containing protein [Verrucomicrobiae bacterium]|nr:DUF4267 domain-containing protein [Verrucomicrobiae bacterium]